MERLIAIGSGNGNIVLNARSRQRSETFVNNSQALITLEFGLGDDMNIGWLRPHFLPGSKIQTERRLEFFRNANLNACFRKDALELTLKRFNVLADKVFAAQKPFIEFGVLLRLQILETLVLHLFFDHG